MIPHGAGCTTLKIGDAVGALHELGAVAWVSIVLSALALAKRVACYSCTSTAQQMSSYLFTVTANGCGQARQGQVNEATSTLSVKFYSAHNPGGEIILSVPAVDLISEQACFRL